MISPDDTTDTTTGPYERSSRTVTRREIINEKRQRQTDILPRVNGETTSGGKLALRQMAHMREENKRCAGTWKTWRVFSGNIRMLDHN
jgi:hypothetical protein